MTTTVNQLDLSLLPPASRREILDFYQFLLERGGTEAENQADKGGQTQLHRSVRPALLEG